MIGKRMACLVFWLCLLTWRLHMMPLTGLYGFMTQMGASRSRVSSITSMKGRVVLIFWLSLSGAQLQLVPCAPSLLVPWGGRNDRLPPISVSIGCLALAFIYLFNGIKMGATSEFQGYGSRHGLEKNVEEELGSWSLEDDSSSYLVEYLEEKQYSDYWEQGFVLSRIEVLLLENLV